MSDAALRKMHTWITIIVAITALISFVKLAGANDRAIGDHERRIQLLEQKFERSMENQAQMSGDIRVIRAVLEEAKETMKQNHPK